MLSKNLVSKSTLWGALFILTTNLFAQDWKDPQWLRLLHSNESLFGYESEADGANFFLHSAGKHSPELELEALIRELDSDHPDETKNAHCRFPARVRWLSQRTGKSYRSKIDCKNLTAFRERMSARSVAVVFSSYYLNNPASSFGHTFLRLGKGGGGGETATELLDTGINYGAVTGSAGPILYSLGGLSGLFNGTFNAIPYYYKVREYNDFETRDLWSYHLSFTQEELDLMVDHIWELGHTHFQYFFLSENCSYHVLTILEAVRPSINLRQHLPNTNTIPSTTLRALVAEKLVSNVSFRPAPSTLFYHQLSTLTESERGSLAALINKKSKPPEANPMREALVYDTAISYMDFKHAKAILKGESEAVQLKRPLLIARSKIPVRSPDLDFTSQLQKAPHLGHGQRRFGVSGVDSRGERYLDLDWRFAFHDLLDFELGYPPRTRIEVMSASVRTDGSHVQLRNLNIVDVFNLGRLDRFSRSVSWKMKVGQWQTRRNEQDLSTQGAIGGVGLSRQWKSISPFALVHFEAAYVSEALQKVKLGVGTDSGILFDLSDNVKLLTALEWRLEPWDESRFLNELRFSNSSYGVGVQHQKFLRNGDSELAGRFFYYF